MCAHTVYTYVCIALCTECGLDVFDASHLHSCTQSALPCPPQMLAELLLESIVEQGGVGLLCSSLSGHERHQGVQAVALRTLVLLTARGR